jgi:putative flippase GtrA
MRRAAGESIVGQIVRYGAVAGSGYIMAITFYSGELAVGVPAYPALGVAFVLNSVFNFVLMRACVFPPSGRSAGSDLGRFCAAGAVSFTVNYSSFALLYSAIGLRATLAQRLAILIAAPVTFLANRLWAFRAGTPSREASVS